MNLKRFIDQNNKMVWYVALIIVFIFLGTRWLNFYYQQQEQVKKEELEKNIAKKEVDILEQIKESDYAVQSDSVEVTLSSFVNYCNKRELDKAYKMLTEECKSAMFPTIQDFEQTYINKIYNIERTFELLKWSTDGENLTYLVTLYGDLLATGGTANTTQEYCTFVKQNNETFKMNINNYIYGEERNLETTVQGITIKIGKVDIYEEYESAEITIINNTSKAICLTGNKYNENIYLKNSSGTEYSSLNSDFDSEEIVLQPNSKQTFWVEFNKVYSSLNKADTLVLSDVILDYEEYLKFDDKKNYMNRKSINVRYE